MIFGTNLSTLNIGPMMKGKARWQEAEATRKYFNTVLIRQEKKFFTSELFKVIQDAIPLILHSRTIFFRTISSSTFILLDGCAVSLHPITNSGSVAGGQNSSRDRQTVFFTAVNPMHKNHKDPYKLDLTKPRLASYEERWKRHRDTVYWVDIQLAQRKRLKFYQTRSNAIILYDTLPAYFISKAILTKSEEIIHQKVFVSPRQPPTFFYIKKIGCAILDSDIAGSSKDIQRIEPTANTQLSSTVRPVFGEKEEIEERTKFDRDTLNQERHDEVTDPTSTGRPVGGHDSTKRCVSTPKHVENDQTGTEKPVTVDQKEEHKIDFQSTRTVTLSCKGSRSLIVRCFLHPLNSSSLSSVSTSCPISSPPLFCSSSMWSEPPSDKSLVHPQNEEYGPVALQNLLARKDASKSSTRRTSNLSLLPSALQKTGASVSKLLRVRFYRVLVVWARQREQANREATHKSQKPPQPQQQQHTNKHTQKQKDKQENEKANKTKSNETNRKDQTRT